MEGKSQNRVFGAQRLTYCAISFYYVTSYRRALENPKTPTSERSRITDSIHSAPGYTEWVCLLRQQELDTATDAHSLTSPTRNG